MSINDEWERERERDKQFFLNVKFCFYPAKATRISYLVYNLDESQQVVRVETTTPPTALVDNDPEFKAN